MLGQVVSRGWVVAILWLGSFGLPSQASAVQMPDPDLLMSETGLMLLEIDDVPGTMMRAKKFYDGVYKEYRERGVLGPLQTPMTQYIFQQAKGDQPTHWLIKAVDSIATEGTELEKVWRPIAEKLAKDPSQITSEEDDEVIAAFARLFKGKMFIGEEDFKPYRTTIFGFEYDPQVFDWMKELRLVAERQRERYGYEDQSATVSGIEVVHMPNEGWFVFSINDVVYGVVERELESSTIYVERALQLSQGQRPVWMPLRSDRRYQRAVNAPDTSDKPLESDVFFYLDQKSYNQRACRFTSALRPPEQRGPAPVSVTRNYDAYSCFTTSCTFSSSSSELIQVYCYYLTVPFVERVNFVHDVYAPLDLQDLPPIHESARDALIYSPVNVGELRPRLRDFQSRWFMLSARIQSADPNPGSWEMASPDIYSVFEQFVKRELLGSGVAYLVLNLEHEGVNYDFPVAVFRRGVDVSSQILLDEIVRYVESGFVSQDVLTRVKGTGSFDVPRKGSNYSKLPTHRLLDSRLPDRDSTVDQPQSAVARILQKGKIQGSDVAYIGSDKVNYVFLEFEDHIYIIPNVNEFGTSKLIDAISKKAPVKVQIPVGVMSRIELHDRVIQCSFHREPGFRSTAMEGHLASVAHGSFVADGDETRYVADFLKEDMSVLKGLYRLCVDVISGQSDDVERKHIGLDSARNTIEWFRVLAFRNDSLIQIGSMKLP